MSAAPIKILVVDDEPPIRKLLRMGLSTQGYEILDAPNGKTALELLGKSPDLVILGSFIRAPAPGVESWQSFRESRVYPPVQSPGTAG